MVYQRECSEIMRCCCCDLQGERLHFHSPAEAQQRKSRNGQSEENGGVEGGRYLYRPTIPSEEVEKLDEFRTGVPNHLF